MTQFTARELELEMANIQEACGREAGNRASTYPSHFLRRLDMGAAKESISTINSLLLEVAGHLEVGKPAGERAAFEKLRRISALATTLALTVKLSR